MDYVLNHYRKIYRVYRVYSVDAVDVLIKKHNIGRRFGSRDKVRMIIESEGSCILYVSGPAPVLTYGSYKVAVKKGREKYFEDLGTSIHSIQTIALKKKQQSIISRIEGMQQ